MLLSHGCLFSDTHLIVKSLSKVITAAFDLIPMLILKLTNIYIYTYMCVSVCVKY